MPILIQPDLEYDVRHSDEVGACGVDQRFQKSCRRLVGGVHDGSTHLMPPSTTSRTCEGSIGVGCLCEAVDRHRPERSSIRKSGRSRFVDHGEHVLDLSQARLCIQPLQWGLASEQCLGGKKPCAGGFLITKRIDGSVDNM